MSLILAGSVAVLVIRLVRMLCRRLTRRRAGGADLIGICEDIAAAVAAGEGVESAMARYPTSCAANLRGTLDRINRRVGLGVPLPHALGLEATGARCQTLASIGVAIDRSHQLGQPLAPALRQLGQELRSQNHARQAKAVSRAAPIAGLITALVIAPACVLALAVLAVGGALISAQVY
jgi:Flp pilus assembly protein TadB